MTIKPASTPQIAGALPKNRRPIWRLASKQPAMPRVSHSLRFVILRHHLYNKAIDFSSLTSSSLQLMGEPGAIEPSLAIHSTAYQIGILADVLGEVVDVHRCGSSHFGIPSFLFCGYIISRFYLSVKHKFLNLNFCNNFNIFVTISAGRPEMNVPGSIDPGL